MVGIYKIENLQNGKVYIGQSVDVEHRLQIHKANLRHGKHDNSHLQSSWDKHGESNFSFDVIEECSRSELDEKEIYWIDYYSSYIRENGYNIELGGHINTFYKPVLRFTLTGDFVDEWNSPRDASICLNIDIQSITNCCRKLYKYGSGYIWVYKDNYHTESDLDWYLDRKKYRRVLQINRNAEIVSVWDSRTQAEKELGYDIAQCLTHQTYTAHDYIFVYEDECMEINQAYCDRVFTILNNINNKPFYQVSSDGDIVKYYNSLREAEEDGYNGKMINDCVRGLRIKYKNFLWIYTDQYDANKKDVYKELCQLQRKRVDVPILQYKDGILINRYEHLKDIPASFNKSNVADTCKGRKPQYKGYVWKYKIND